MVDEIICLDSDYLEDSQYGLQKHDSTSQVVLSQSTLLRYYYMYHLNSNQRYIYLA